MCKTFVIAALATLLASPVPATDYPAVFRTRLNLPGHVLDITVTKPDADAVVRFYEIRNVSGEPVAAGTRFDEALMDYAHALAISNKNAELGVLGGLDEPNRADGTIVSTVTTGTDDGEVQRFKLDIFGDMTFVLPKWTKIHENEGFTENTFVTLHILPTETPGEVLVWNTEAEEPVQDR